MNKSNWTYGALKQSALDNVLYPNFIFASDFEMYEVICLQGPYKYAGW